MQHCYWGHSMRPSMNTCSPNNQLFEWTLFATVQPYEGATQARIIGTSFNVWRVAWDRRCRCHFSSKMMNYELWILWTVNWTNDLCMFRVLSRLPIDWSVCNDKTRRMKWTMKERLIWLLRCHKERLDPIEVLLRLWIHDRSTDRKGQHWFMPEKAASNFWRLHKCW